MNRGEIYQTRERLPERGHKPGFYVVVSRPFVAANDDVLTVICAPIYSEVIGLATEVMVGTDEGLPRDSVIRCDFLALMLKRRLTTLAGRLSPPKIEELNIALARALDLPAPRD